LTGKLNHRRQFVDYTPVAHKSWNLQDQIERERERRIQVSTWTPGGVGCRQLRWRGGAAWTAAAPLAGGGRACGLGTAGGGRACVLGATGGGRACGGPPASAARQLRRRGGDGLDSSSLAGGGLDGGGAAWSGAARRQRSGGGGGGGGDRLEAS